MSDNPDGRPDLTRRNVLQKSALAAGGLTLGTVGLSGSAAADRWDEEIDLTGETIYNPCTDEVATWTSGTLRMDANTRQDASGGKHVSMRVVAYGRLEGNDTELKYEAQGSFSGTMYVAPDEMPKTENITGNVNVTSQGPASNLHLRLRIRTTVNANDVTVVDVKEMSSECI